MSKKRDARRQRPPRRMRHMLSQPTTTIVVAVRTPPRGLHGQRARAKARAHGSTTPD